MRTKLYEAAQVMLTRTNKWSWLKAGAMQIRIGYPSCKLKCGRRIDFGDWPMVTVRMHTVTSVNRG